MSESMVSLRGWLREKMPALRFDKYWFCILSGGRVDLFQKEDSESPTETFTLEDIEQVRAISSCSLPAFQIVFRDKAVKTFMCTKLEEVEKWMCAFTNKAPREVVTVDSFELLSLIGKGISGKVFLAKKKGTEELYAIKVIRKDHVKESVRECRVLAERNILMSAAHQFITRLFYAFQTPEKFYLVLEYVPGGDLRHHLDLKVEFSPYQIRLYIAEIVLALRNLHRMGVIYRDLKPENILLDVNGHIKLADFGLSRQIDQENMAYSLCGTYEYVAPEMLRDEPQTFCVDWWALGVLAYRLIVGHLPFRSCNTKRLFQMICDVDPKIPPWVDKVTASFLEQLLSKNPATRLGGIGTDITSHKYFEGLSWSKVAEMAYEPEFRPSITKSDSVSNFDEEFTQEPAVDSYTDKPQFTLKDFSVEVVSAIPSVRSDDEIEDPEADVVKVS